MYPSRKVAFNTLILYIRAFMTMGITFYTTRLLLEVMGVSDFGIYNLISGLVSLFAIFNVAMSVSSQRYLSYYQGKNDTDKQRRIFSCSVFLHLLIAVVFLLALELAGLFLFDGFLNLPAQRLDASRWSYQLMIISVVFSVLCVPFTASINAHENMIVMALVNILEAVLRLLSVFALMYFSQDNRLVWFSVFNAFISFVSFILYLFFCVLKYSECTVRILKWVRREDLRELGSFAGWNLMGSLCGMGRVQGISLLLNLYLGVGLNAAYGLAFQLGGYVSFFSATLLQTFNPQIMKSEGSGDRARMLRLSMSASKLAFFLFAVLAIPCVFEMPGILCFWLGQVPPYTLVFCVLLIIGTLVNQLTVGLQSAIQATGNIKMYQFVIGSTILLNLPIAWLLLKNGYSPVWIFVVYVLIEALACSLRLYFIRRQASLSLRSYFKTVFACELLPVTICVSVCLGMRYFLDIPYRFVLTFAVSVPLFLLSVYFFGLSLGERRMVNDMFISAINKFKTKSV